MSAARENLRTSRMTGSAGATMSVASASIPSALSAASAPAVAVWRPEGASRIAEAGISIARSCSATVKRCASLHTTIGATAPVMVARRAAVSCSMVCLPVRASSCFGYISRDNGHSRVPAPPERITGITALTIRSLREFSSTDRIVIKTRLLHLFSVVEIAPVEDGRGTQRGLYVVEIRTSELAPLGHDGQGIGTLQRFRTGLAEREVGALAIDPPALRHGDRIVRAHLRARGPQRLEQDPACRPAPIIGIGLECQSPDRQGLAAQIAEMRLDLMKQDLLLAMVDAFDRGENAGVIAHFLGGALQRLNVLGKAGPAVPHPGINEGI